MDQALERTRQSPQATAEVIRKWLKEQEAMQYQPPPAGAAPAPTGA